MKKKQIVPALLLIAVFTLFLPWQSEAQQLSRIKPQTEAGFDLTKAAADRILQEYSFTSEDRTDFYIDMYDGQNLLIDSAPGAYKFRMKITDGEGVVQVNTKASIQNASCPTTPDFVINEKNLGELTLDKSQRSIFANLASRQQSELSSQPEKAAAAIKDLHQFVQKLSVPLISEIQKIPTSGSRWFYVSSFMAKKTKFAMKLKFPEGKIKVSITQGSDYLGSDLFQNRNEIEFQHDGSISRSDFNRIICSFMAEQNLATQDFDFSGKDIAAEVLRRLSAVDRSLGLP